MNKGGMKMKKMNFLTILIIIVGVSLVLSSSAQENMPEKSTQGAESEILQLPEPRLESDMSVEKALSLRRSTRTFSEEALSLSDIAQILWAGQGFTKKREEPPSKWNVKYEWQGGYRTAPSAGAQMPMELYVVAGNVKGLEKAVYKYIPQTHSIKKVLDGDKRMDVYNVALKQNSIKEGAALIIMSGVYERTSFKYGDRAQRYVHIEVGAILENIYLQCGALGLGTVMVGAFKDEQLKNVLDLPEDEHPLAIMPLGKIHKE